MEFKEQFLCRASGAGSLMTDPKKKTDTLSKTTITFLNDWMKEQIYGYRKNISTKQMEKGIEYEDAAIETVIDWCDLPFVVKNETRFTDDYFTGEPDLLTEDTVIDIKNSWDFSTFPLFEDEIPTDGYEYQVQVYMHLTGKKKASVIYVLLTTPESYNNTELTYDHVETKYRYKRFDFVYDPEIIAKLQQRILDCRTYIKQKQNELSSKN
jgi:hypothetical protein